MIHQTEWPSQVKARLNNSSFQTGTSVKVRLATPENAWNNEMEELSCFDVQASVYRAGNPYPVLRTVVSAERLSRGFQPVWRIPEETATGRYTLRLQAQQKESDQTLITLDEFSFAVWKSELRIESFDTDQRFYSPGDPIFFELKLVNHGPATLRNLQVEVGEWQYPWITSVNGSLTSQAVFASSGVTLRRGEARIVRITGITNSKANQSSVQYTACVRMAHAEEMIAFRSTPPVFLRHYEKADQPIYPMSYMHSDLSQIRTEGYRQFYAQKQADHLFSLSRTSFRACEVNEVAFRSLMDLSVKQVEVELQSETGERVDGALVQLGETGGRAALRFGSPGLYSLTIRSVPDDGSVQVFESIQVSANVLPKSLVIIGAHPDDEFLHPAVIRAAVENAVPVHIIFLTSGDAGGSDRFFGVEYSPAEAIEFGHIRMAEAQAAARHLGIPSENLHFLGLPDGFLEIIRTPKNGQRPVFSPLLGVDHSPYQGTVEFNLPFERGAVLQALTSLLARIQPDTIYTSHPDERHADHKAAGWFTIEALQLMLHSRQLEEIPSLRTDQFYGASQEIAAPFVYQSHQLFASGEVMARVQEAYWFYQTQGGNHARGHVLDYQHLPRTEHHQEVANWATTMIHSSFPLVAAS